MRQKYELPNERAFVDGPVIHHFDEHSWRGVRPRRRGPDGQPIGEDLKRNPLDIAKAEPLDECYLGTEGGGAESTPGYLGLDGVDADTFYAESAPIWWTPARMFDLRDTWTTFYLKEVKPISVALGYEPHLFVAAYLPDNHPPRVRISCWVQKEVLRVGKGEWAFNEVKISTDESKWINYHTENNGGDTLDLVLGKCQFIGWMYTKGAEYNGVHATGTMGWDEFKFNLKEPDLQAIRAGREFSNALVFY